MTVENRTETGPHRFQPGNQMAVGRGRPAVARDFRERCRAFMEQPDGGWQLLRDLAMDQRGRDRFQALQLIAAYAYGKPTQPLTGEDGQAIPIRVIYEDGPPQETP